MFGFKLFYNYTLYLSKSPFLLYSEGNTELSFENCFNIEFILSYWQNPSLWNKCYNFVVILEVIEGVEIGSYDDIV